MNNSRLFRLSRVFIALTATGGLLINSVSASESTHKASQYTQQINQNYTNSLPFNDRQDFDDAQRGLSRHCSIRGFCAHQMAKCTTVAKILNLISMRQHRKPLTQVCGASRS